MARLDAGPLRAALEQLNTSLAYCDSSLARQDAGIARQFQSAAIQAFEFTYELSHKMLRCHLSMVEASVDAVDRMSFQDMIREGRTLHLVKTEWQVWSDFRRARSITRHTYNEASARQVFEMIPRFVEEVS